MVDVITHVSKLKGVAEMTNKTKKQDKTGLHVLRLEVIPFITSIQTPGLQCPRSIYLEGLSGLSD